MGEKGSQCGPSGNQIIYLVEEQRNPSTDYFLLPAFSLSSGLTIVRCGFADLPEAGQLSGGWVVFVRYVPPAWARLIASLPGKLGGLVFFMDDDVLDTRAAVGMPLRYRFKLARLAAWRRRWLRRHGAALWVSTPYLQQKYAQWSPRLLPPAPIDLPANVRRVFYHGSASHESEIRWLRPIMAEVLRRDERSAFEIIGGMNVYRLYRGLPRVTVVHPMKWPAYQAFLSMPGRHVGLAPLHDAPFNRARSYTKFFDVTRCGAVGVYSSGSACADVVSHHVEGLSVDLKPELWVDAILSLTQDDALRQRLLGNAQKKQAELADKIG